MGIAREKGDFPYSKGAKALSGQGVPGGWRALCGSRRLALIKNSETDDFVGCIGTVRVLFMG